MNKLFSKIKKYILNDTNILIYFFSIPYYLFRIFKIKNNKILIVNFMGKGYGDSGKYIADYILSSKHHSEYKIYWAINNKKYLKSLPNQIVPIKINTIKYIYHLVTSKVWINNSRFAPYVRKRKDQFYIQTWHSSLRLKKIEMDISSMLSKYYIKSITNDSKMIDLMIAGSQFSFDTYRRAFMYNGKIEKIGTPRCDILFNKNFGNKIRKNLLKDYSLDKNKKIILYAPTFRDYSSNNNWMIDFNKLFKKIGNNYNFLIRLHPNVKNSNLLNIKGTINVSDYPDMQELLCAVDMLITDYSGCSFDMLIAKKPCILYVNDLDDYLKHERELYFDIKSLPFCLSYNIEQLARSINNFDKKEYNSKMKNFFNEIKIYEKGNASKKIYNIIEEVVNNEKI